MLHSAAFEDFRKLNRTAAKSGVRTATLECNTCKQAGLRIHVQLRNARDLSEFRRFNDIKLVPPGPVGVLPKVIPSDVIPSSAWHGLLACEVWMPFEPGLLMAASLGPPRQSPTWCAGIAILVVAYWIALFVLTHTQFPVATFGIH